MWPDFQLSGSSRQLRFNRGQTLSSHVAVDLFERALALDPQLVPAMVGLVESLVNRVTNLFSVDPKADIARAEDFAERAIVAEPENSAAHMAKAQVLIVSLSDVVRPRY